MNSDPEAYAASVRATFRRSLRIGRQDLDLTQRQLGERAGINSKSVWAIETGQQEPGLSTIARLAVAVGLEVPMMLTTGTDPGGSR